MAGDSLTYPGQHFPVGVSNEYGWIAGGQAASQNSTPVTPTGEAYWLPVFSGEVINAYDQYNIFEPMVATETIESGTTKRFPITGTVGHKGRWAAGEELVGDSSATASGWFDISLDQRPMAAFFELDDIATLITQWDYRSELARQAGLELSYIRDKQIACMIAQAAFSVNRAPFSSSYAGMNHSTNLVLAPDAIFNNLGNRATGVTATMRTDAALLLLSYLEKYMVQLSEIDAKLGEVYCAVTPQAFHDIRALGIARDATGLVGGAGRPFFGGVAEAGGLGAGLQTNLFGLTEKLEYMGVTICKSNHLAQLEYANVFASAAANVTKNAFSTSTGLPTAASRIPMIHDLGDTKYDINWGKPVESDVSTVDLNGDGSGNVDAGDTFSPIKALIWQKSAVCSLRLQGMKVETVKDVRRGTFFTVASIMGGAGILRPELCGAIQGSVPAVS